MSQEPLSLVDILIHQARTGWGTDPIKGEVT